MLGDKGLGEDGYQRKQAEQSRGGAKNNFVGPLALGFDVEVSTQKPSDRQ